MDPERSPYLVDETHISRRASMRELSLIFATKAYLHESLLSPLLVTRREFVSGALIVRKDAKCMNANIAKCNVTPGDLLDQEEHLTKRHQAPGCYRAPDDCFR